MAAPKSLIGTAGWSVHRDLPQFPQEGSGLERYAAVFNAVEVNTSFYRRHRQATWQRWHDAVPADFRFSVKLPRTITHERALAAPEDLLDDFFSDVAPLGDKLGAVLIQLPPRLAFQPTIAETFLAALRARSAVAAFVEPRHASWAEGAASALFATFAIGRVHADPQQADLRAASADSSYLRLHGSPEIYHSAYGEADLARYAKLLRERKGPAWCIFDNTGSGAALHDALKLQDLLANDAGGSQQVE